MRFRGHHLICLHFYKGEGYEQKFIDSLSELVARANEGETVNIVSGPDDVCQNCPYLNNNQCNQQNDSEVEILKLDDKALKFLGLKPGIQVKWLDLKNKVDDAEEWLQDFCFGCQWADVCKR